MLVCVNQHSVHMLIMYILGSIHSGATPTLRKLKTMKGADGTPLNIIEKIAGGDYVKFGICLLQDEKSDIVEGIVSEHKKEGAKSVTLAILRKWLRSGAPTLTYQHLIKCLEQSELGTVADNIIPTQ